MLYYIPKNRYYIIKEYLEQFSKFAFQEVTRPVRQPNTFTSILPAHRHTFVAQNHRTSVGYTTAQRTEDYLYQSIFL